MLSQISVLAFLSFTGAALAMNYDVKVGSSGLAYSPNSLTAVVGDTVTYHFYPGQHNVVQGDFSNPCGATSGGFYSGFINSASGASSTTFTITIKDTKPIWYYCSQTFHCQSGMVGVINPPASGNTIDAYTTASSKTTNSTTPGAVTGGTVGSGSSSASASSSSSSSASSGSMSATASSSSSSDTSAPTTATSTSAGSGTTTAGSTAAATTSAKPNGAAGNFDMSLAPGGLFAIFLSAVFGAALL